jgi:hypothetical protein
MATCYIWWQLAIYNGNLPPIAMQYILAADIY